MTKLLETYTIPKIGEINIFQKEKSFNCFFESSNQHELVLTECKTRSGARRASEGYLNAKYFNKLNEFCSHINEGWIKQFQTYPTKSRGKKN